MKVLILLSFAAVALATHECEENSHYDSCGTACPLTCKNYKNPPKACVLMCNPGCHCDKGYVKTEDGRCVEPELCSAETEGVCGENEEYQTCGTACPLTCDNYQNPPKICTLQCMIGCACKKGFVRAGAGRCVRPEQCQASATELKSCVGAPDSGKCKAFFPMWHYDAKTGRCKKFIYGGCGGNGNRYNTEDECMENCGVNLNESSTNNICELPHETGPCRAYSKKFFFNKATGQCETFIYGGCKGNLNKFDSAEECQQTCGQTA